MSNWVLANQRVTFFLSSECIEDVELLRSGKCGLRADEVFFHPLLLSAASEGGSCGSV